jgi:hypothetical protein
VRKYVPLPVGRGGKSARMVCEKKIKRGKKKGLNVKRNRKELKR